jgi:putative NADPH-quinone reductase
MKTKSSISKNFKCVLMVYSNPNNNIYIEEVYKKTINYYERNNSINVLTTIIDNINFEGLYTLSRQSSMKDTQAATTNSNFEINQGNLQNNEQYDNANKIKYFEQEKVREADLIIYIFPLLWLSPPSKLKAWFELVFEETFAFNLEKNQFFINGLLKGKYTTCLCAVNEKKKDFGYKGKYILTVEELLEHLTHGVLGFSGLSVFSPFILYSNDDNSDISQNLDNYLKNFLDSPIIYN